MFDLFSGSHILILLAVMLVVVGPKDLPRLMRIMGQWAGKARRMANEFKKSFEDMARQEELDKLRLELDELRRTNVDAMAHPIAGDTGPEPRSGEFQVNETAPAAPQGDLHPPPEPLHPPAEPAAQAGPPVP